jgi:hypothetical protein
MSFHLDPSVTDPLDIARKDYLESFIERNLIIEVHQNVKVPEFNDGCSCTPNQQILWRLNVFMIIFVKRTYLT